MSMHFIIHFLLLGTWTSSILAEFCPSRRANTSTIDYKVTERFNQFRSVHPTFTVSHQHLRRTVDTFEYTVTFCPSSKGSAAVTQKDDKGNVKTIGKADQSSVVTGGVDWLLVQYMNGEKYGTHCNGQNMQAWVLLQCEEGTRKENFHVVEESRYHSSDKSQSGAICYFLFEMNSKLVCSERSSTLSGGAIFCIILFALFLAYFIFGFAYQRFVTGAKGYEQIPNFPFWRKIGNLSADGCVYICRREDHPNTYKGMADALDIDSSDDDKDDGLLPM